MISQCFPVLAKTRARAHTEFDKTKIIVCAEDVPTLLAKVSPGSALKSTPSHAATPRASAASSASASASAAAAGSSKKSKAAAAQQQGSDDVVLHLTGLVQPNAQRPPAASATGGKLKKHAADYF